MQRNFLKSIHATYDILEAFPDEDPLKVRARETALSILQQITMLFGVEGWVSLGNMLDARRYEIAQKTIQDIMILEEYLRLGKSRGWVNGMNFLIIIKEYRAIKEEILLIKKIVPDTLLLANNHGQRNTHLVAPDIEVNRHKEKKEKEEVQQYSNRQEKILKILEQQDKVQVADIVKEIPDITKRTIRRDLDELLKRGDVVRLGEFNQVFYQKSDRTI